MNIVLKNLLTILFLIACVGTAKSQNKAVEFSAYIGGSLVYLFDSGYGSAFSVNPTYNLGENFKIESRFAFSSVTITDSFISGKEGNIKHGIFQVGPRYVFRSVDKKIRPAISLLMGYQPVLSKTGESFESDESSFSASFNIDAAFDRFVVGVSLEDYHMLLFKLGYQFN
ncbi:MAG: hypothetical protein P8P48_01150 [Saprospiraceae bacterium]|nr:hypothetical protein [Saprospiraceae bacterium]